MEKQLRLNCVSSTLSKPHDIANQHISVVKAKFFKTRSYQHVLVTCFLLILFTFASIHGAAKVFSTQIFQLPNHAHIDTLDFRRIVKGTRSLSSSSSSSNSQCEIPNEKCLERRYHDDNVFAEAFKKFSFEAGGHSMVKRATSNRTGIAEELPTAPMNAPSITASTVLVPPISIDATSDTVELPIPHVTSHTKSLETDASASTPSSLIKTLTSKPSSTISSSEPTAITVSQAITTLTGGSPDNDLPSSTTKVANSPSPVKTVLTRETIYTTTLPNGALSTSTSTTIVQVNPENTDLDGATKTKAPPGLQTNIAQRMGFSPIHKAIAAISVMSILLLQGSL